MTKQYLIDIIDDLKERLKTEEVEGASELTITRVIDSFDNVVTTLKNDES